MTIESINEDVTGRDLRYDNVRSRYVRYGDVRREDVVVVCDDELLA